MPQDILCEVGEDVLEALRRLALASGTTIEDEARVALTKALGFDNPETASQLDPFSHARTQSLE